MKKHLVYAEDLLCELMQHPDNAIYKFELRQLITKFAEEHEVSIGSLMPTAGYDLEDK